MKTFLTILITAVCAATATWLWVGHAPPPPPSTTAETIYQCAMHPWIQSDKPGRCTICGMELVRVTKGAHADHNDPTIFLSDSQIRVTGIRTAEVKKQPLQRTLRVAGMIDDDERRHRILSAYVDARIDKLYANHHGAEVEAGTPLAKIFSPALLQARREYLQLSGDLKAGAALRLQRMGLDEAQIQKLSNGDPNNPDIEILAPLSGTVVEHDVYEGQYVKEGDKLFEIADFSVMWFQFMVYEQDLPWISVGQKVTVTTPSQPGKTFEGKVAFIDPNIDDATRSAKIRVELPNPAVNGRRAFLHKLYGEGEVRLDMPATLAVPKTALLQAGSQSIVYIDRGDGHYARTPVRTGRRGDDAVEVLSGLQAGDRVVTHGNLLIDGQAQLERSALPDETATSTDPDPAALHDFLTEIDAVSAALGADDFNAFQKASGDLPKAVAKLKTTFGDAGAAKLAKLADFTSAGNLGDARLRFLDFSQTTTELLAPLRDQLHEVQVWECPMVREAVPKGPAKGRWIQMANRPIQNPYFGKAMPGCGEKIEL